MALNVGIINTPPGQVVLAGVFGARYEAFPSNHELPELSARPFISSHRHSWRGRLGSENPAEWAVTGSRERRSPPTAFPHTL